MKNSQSKLDTFTKNYITSCLELSSDDPHSPSKIADVLEDTFNKMVSDCAQFQKENRKELENVDLAQAGTDFYLTRNGHGAGFWDRGLGDVGEILTDRAIKFGYFDI